MLAATLLAVAAAGPVNIDAAQLGPIPDDCDLNEEQAADGVDLTELVELAECLAELDAEDRGGDVNRGVALYRLALEMSQADPTLPPSRGDLRYRIVRAYGINGDIPAMLREADTLSTFVESSPSLRCEFFDRLAVEIEQGDQFEAAQALSNRFDLSSCPRYVPRYGWSRPDFQPAFYERWWGNQLLAMGERPFSQPGLLSGYVQRFRLTVLPSFTPGFAARIDRLPNGSSRLHWVILDGAGGYGPGKVAKSGDRLLSARETFLLNRALRKADLAGIPMEEPSELDHTDPETGETYITICTDGTQWLFELLTAGSQTFVERSFCNDDNDDLVKLIDTTYALLPPELTGDTEG